jgi:hypothetical protein
MKTLGTIVLSLIAIMASLVLVLLRSALLAVIRLTARSGQTI